MNGVSNKILMFVAAVAGGYLLTAAWLHFFPPSEPTVEHRSNLPVVEDPEILLASQSGGMDLPWEVRMQMLGQPVKARSNEPAASLSVPRAQPDFAFVIGENLQDHIDDARERLRSPEGSRQENGETEETLDAMAREGRMAW